MVKMGTVGERTAEFLTDNLGTILPVSLLAYLVPLSISGNFMTVRDGASVEFQSVLVLLRLAFAALALWGSLTLTALVFEPENRSAGAVGVRRFVPALLVSIVTFAGLVIIWAPLFLLIPSSYGEAFPGLFRTGGTDLPTAARGAAALYLLCAFVLCLWLSARLIVVSAVVVAEKRVFGAIARSWSLTRGMALRIVGVILLYALVAVVAVLATRVVFGSVFQLISGSRDAGMSLAHVLTAVMVAAVQTGFTLIVPVFTAKLYIALVQREAAATPA